MSDPNNPNDFRGDSGRPNQGWQSGQPGQPYGQQQGQSYGQQGQSYGQQGQSYGQQGQQYEQHQGYPPAQPPKKRKKWPWVLGVLVILIIVIAVATSQGSDSSGSDNASGSATSGQAHKDKNAPAALNAPVRDGKFEFVVSDSRSGVSEVGDNEFLTQKAQGQFVIVTMSVKNIANKPQSFDPSSQKITDTQGRTFEPSTEAQVAMSADDGSDIPVWDNINPGNSAQVKVVFDMPKDATPATIELHDSAFSNGKKVALT